MNLMEEWMVKEWSSEWKGMFNDIISSNPIIIEIKLGCTNRWK